MKINSIDAFRALVELGRLIAEEKADALPANSIIDISPALKLWETGAYSAGNLVQYNEQPWRCLQTHDSTGNPNWCPGVAPSLWAAYHGTAADHALPWQAPTGAHDCYNSGEYMTWTDGGVYLCNANGTVHDPGVLPVAWQLVSE